MNFDLFGNPVPPPTSHTQRRRAHLTFRGNIHKGRHGWLRLTPAYSLHVVQEILEERSADDFVLDPFSGTGTTPLASAMLGIPAHAVDINPFLVWLGNIKLRQYPPNVAEELRLQASRCVADLRLPLSSTLPWIPALHQIEKWWSRTTLEALASLFARIECVAEHHDTALLNLLKIAFCRVMIETSQVSFGHQSMSFKKRSSIVQGSLLNPHELTEAHAVVGSRFLSAIEEIVDSLTSEQPMTTAHVFSGDARELEKTLPQRCYTKVVTSPPYPNRMSYIRELRPYMYWLGFLTNGRQAGELDWAAIGGTWGCATSNLNAWMPSPDQTIPYPKFDIIVSAIGTNHKLLGRYVHKYFQDIKAHLHSLRRVMARHGRCYYVVGNSKFYQTLLPVEEIYAALFEDVGFINLRIERLRKRNSKKELFEYIVYAEVP